MLMSKPHEPIPFFFFNDSAHSEIYTLSLHDALPICSVKFNNNFRAPLASSFCRWRSSSSLSPIVDLPRRSTMVTSSRLRVEIVRPTTSPSDLHPVMVPISPHDYTLVPFSTHVPLSEQNRNAEPSKRRD